jgi:UDP-N-acetylglucosamine 4,6-dehydratase
MPDTPSSPNTAGGHVSDLRTFDSPEIDLDGKVVMVTGGTGSFGQSFISAVLKKSRPRKLIVFSRDELKQYEMAQRFSEADHPALRYFIGDVRDTDRLEMAMREVDYVVHAAALKHVPTAEYNPFECVATNINGAQNVVTAALRTNVERVIALSTDKAANPINLYGATKLASDKIFVAANNLSGENGTQFSVVRYGNVLGSRGSVIPFFQRLLAEGATSLPITDQRMTRFWITLSQGVNFVLSSMAMMQGGEIFVPKVSSMRITELARTLAPDCDLEDVGIRPGEKLHEILITQDDARNTIELDDRFVIWPAAVSWDPSAYRARGARAVDDGFSYVSDENKEWLSTETLQKLLGAAKV